MSPRRAPIYVMSFFFKKKNRARLDPDRGNFLRVVLEQVLSSGYIGAGKDRSFLKKKTQYAHSIPS